MTKIKLEKGVKIERIKPQDYEKLIENVKETTKKSLKKVLYPINGIVNPKDGYIYYVILKKKDLKSRDYFINLENKLRLFKEGYVTFPIIISYAKIIDNKMVDAQSIITKYTISHSSDKYTLSDKEIIELNKLIKTYEIPFKKYYLQLALDNLVSSKTTNLKELKFLLLMIGFESLFNKGHQQITHTIARHTALLMGNTKKESNTLYDEIKEFYNIRSKIVHGSYKTVAKRAIKKEDIIKLRNLLRACIKKIYKLDLEKKELFRYLNERGFNDRT